MFPSKQTKVKFHGNSLEVNMQVALIPTSKGLASCSHPYRLVTNLSRFIKLGNESLMLAELFTCQKYPAQNVLKMIILALRQQFKNYNLL